MTREEAIVAGIFRPRLEAFDSTLAELKSLGSFRAALEMASERGLAEENQHFLHIYDCDRCGGHGRSGYQWDALCGACGGGGVEYYVRRYPETLEELAGQIAGNRAMQTAHALVEEFFSCAADAGLTPRGPLLWRGGDAAHSTVRDGGVASQLARRWNSELPLSREGTLAQERLQQALTTRRELDRDVVRAVLEHHAASWRWKTAAEEDITPTRKDPFEPILDLWAAGFALFDWGRTGYEGVMLPLPVRVNRA